MFSFAHALLVRPGDPQVSVLGIIVLVVDILIIVSLVKSHKTFLVKLIWILLVLFTGPIGWILYFFLGREKR